MVKAESDEIEYVTIAEYRDRVEGTSVSEQGSVLQLDTMLVGQKAVEKAIEDEVYIVFVGGACNIVDQNGKLVRNVGRDKINTKLSKLGIVIFDPQIHPLTHKRGYVYELDADGEKLVVDRTRNALFEIRPDTAGPVTCFEVLRNARKGSKGTNNRVVLVDGFDPVERVLDFRPKGIAEGAMTEAARRMHFSEYEKNANNMRKELINMMRTDKHLSSEENPRGNLKIVMDKEKEGDSEHEVKLLVYQGADHIEITNKKAHFKDLLKAFKLSGDGKDIVVYFRGTTKDKKGNPTVSFGEYPTRPSKTKGAQEDIIGAMKMATRYIEEVNEMRRLFVTYLDQDKDTDIVSSQEEALEVILRNRETHLRDDAAARSSQ